MPDYPRSEKFSQTDWSLVRRIGRAGTEGKREALGQLMTSYLPALRAHLVYRKGFSPDEADDLLQDFVVNKIIEKDLVAQARHEAGKFRTFLLTALNRFVINRIRDQKAKKRSPERGAVVLMGDDVEHIQSDEEPEQALHAAWAHGVISEALRRMQAQCESSGRSDVWGVFQCRIVAPILEGSQPVDYRELIERFGFQSPAQASNVLATAKRMYARTIRDVVGEYAQNDEEIEVEIEELKGILSRPQ